MKRSVLLFIATIVCLLVDAQSAKMRENYKQEVTYLTQKIKEKGEDISLIYARAKAYDNLNNFEASNKDFKKVLELYLDHPKEKYAEQATDACYFLADDYFFRNADRIKAQIYIDHGIAISKDHKKFEALEVGILGTYPEKADEAQSKFEELVSKYPEDEKLLRYYAKFLEKRDLDKSAALYEQVVMLDPYDVDAVFALGSYYANKSNKMYASGEDPRKVLEVMEKGVSYLEMAHLLMPDDHEIMEILVEFYGYLHRDEDKKEMERKLLQ